jgi:hypothetical protein
MKYKNMFVATDCLFDAFKLESDNVLNEIDKCIDEFEDKRTQKW